VALKQEFVLLADVFKTYLPPEYPYDVVGGQRNIKVADFDEKVDILPVADPNIFSQSQRITLAQTELQLAMSNPQMHNMYEAYRDMYNAIGVKDINRILPPPQQPMPMDPAAENILAMSGKPFQAFKGQDHRAHITSHLNFMATNMAKNSPPVMAALQKNIFEHISLMAQEQLEIEFREEIQQLMQLQQMAQQNPQMAQSPEIQQQIMQLSMAIEARKAKLIADMTQEFKDEENKIMGDFGNDPIAKLKARELDLRAMDNEQKRTQAEQRLNLDKSKAMMNQDIQEEKLEQNEELAKLRADTSIEKTILGKTLPNSDQMMPNVAIIRKTGE
jgi:signal transduction histidine kinase